MGYEICGLKKNTITSCTFDHTLYGNMSIYINPTLSLICTILVLLQSLEVSPCSLEIIL